MGARGPELVRATALHANALAAIHAKADPVGEHWSAAAFATLLGQPGVVALIDPAGGLVLSRVAGDEAELLMLSVLPAVRRQGRAQALLCAAEAVMRDAGARAMFLEVHARNLAARSLYDVAGYREVGRRRRYYADGADAVVMRRDLTSGGSAGA